MSRRTNSVRRVLRVGGEPTMTPAQFVATLSAVGSNVLTLVADLGVTVATGASGWADQSGSGDANRNAAQATGANQPTWSASDADFGGRASLTFDGTDFMATGVWSAALAQPCTWYLVSRDTSSVNAYGFLIDGTGAANRHAIYNRTAGSHWPGMYSGTAEVNNGAFTMTNVNAVECVVLDGTDALYVNDSASAKVSGNSGAQSLTGLRIGWNQGGTAGFQYVGKIAAIVAYATAHDATTRASVMRTLGSYYRIAVT